jgi:16S rRNA (uracil1498-N3)-methyltransferase
MDYFYCTQVRGNAFTIDDEEAAHLLHVMRKKEGDEIRIVDGRGTAYDARIESVTKRAASGAILATYPNHHEPACKVTLAVALLKNPSKYDFLVEKVTELGVHEIIPLATERTIPSHDKADRWQKLALAAMKQSGRSYLPVVQPVKMLKTFLAEDRSFGLKLIAHEQQLSGAAAPRFAGTSSVAILVGPEGGFSEGEVGEALAKGFHPWYLGERRLRTETAAIVAVAHAIASVGAVDTDNPLK